MSFYVKITSIALFFTLKCGNLYAENTRYVSDVFYAPLRSGEGNQYRIINKGIRSGTALTLLEGDSQAEWSKVKTPSGLEGWIRSQYLQAEPIASHKLMDLQQQIDMLSALKVENSRLSEELSRRERQEEIYLSLVREHQLLETQVDVLKAENARVADKTKQTWFMNGVYAVGFGVLMTLLLPLLRPRKKYSDWD